VTPILSICVPTFNRADLLQQFLASVLPQVAHSAGKVELIVSDNASTDHTAKVLSDVASKELFVHRNASNVGVLQNVFSVIAAARGEFAWVLGDDDRLHSDAVSSLLRILEEQPDIDAFFLNCTMCKVGDYCGDDTFDAQAPCCEITESKPLAVWEDFVFLGDIPGLGTSIVHHVFRRTRWVDAVGPVRDKINGSTAALTCLADSLPMPLVIGRMMIGKPAFYVGDPMVCVMVGAQEWFAMWPRILLVQGLELADEWGRLGARAEAVQHYRELILGDVKRVWMPTLVDDAPAGLHARDAINLKKLIRCQRAQQALWRSLADCASRLKWSNKWAWNGILRGGWTSLGFWTLFVPSLLSRLKRGLMWRISGWRTSLCHRSASRQVDTRGRLDFRALVGERDAAATAFFNDVVNVSDKNAELKDPVVVKAAGRISVGAAFRAGLGFRVEAWEEYRGDTYSPHITIGDRVSFGANCHVTAINAIDVGDDVLIGSQVVITDHQHGATDAESLERLPRDRGLVSKGPVVIESGVWLGSNVVVMPGVRIGQNSVVGANAVVTRDVPAYSVVGGIPARVIKTCDRGALPSRSDNVDDDAPPGGGR
jgi:acetyltransferase-like isoleucine patch superfamily enzyme/glycosyltransferase involved in cell wall biosynthesis